MLQASCVLSCCGAGEKSVLGSDWSYREHEPPLARAPHDAPGVPAASELKCPPMAPPAPEAPVGFLLARTFAVRRKTPLYFALHNLNFTPKKNVMKESIDNNLTTEELREKLFNEAREMIWYERKQKLLSTRVGKWLKNVWSYVGWDDYLAVLLMVIGVLGYIDGPLPYMPEWDSFYVDIRAEVLGIGLSVLIIGNAVDVISRDQEKRRLVLQAGSNNNVFAIEALRQLRAKGWLKTGALRGARLGGANLNNAKLNHADLRGADFYRAVLRGANLEHCDLRGASLHSANLTNANLNDANLSDTYLYHTEMRGVQYNKNTIWPEKFDPEVSCSNEVRYVRKALV